MTEILQSKFIFSLGDYVSITNPNERSISLKGMSGQITHRGYTDTISPKDRIFPNLYAIFVSGYGVVPGIPESFLELGEENGEGEEKSTA